MANKDYYKVLGVSKNATDKEIKVAYRKLAMKYHPDKLKDGTSDKKMQELNEAYETLKDPQKRAEYDRFGPGGSQGMNFGRAGGAGGFGMSFQDIFNDIFKGFGAGFKRTEAGPKSGGTRAKSTVRRRGNDILTNIVISFSEAIKGTSFSEKYTKFEVCSSCNGNGAMPKDIKNCLKCQGTGRERTRQQTPFGVTEVIMTCSGCGGDGKIVIKPCPKCQGSQYTKKLKTVKIKVVPGSDSGDKIKMPGYGEKGINGGDVGDMYIVINVKPHAFYLRKGLDLVIREFPVSFLDIVKENEIKVPTPNGDQVIKLKSSYNSGTKIRVKGGGIQNKQGAKGDLQLRLIVKMPDYTESHFKEMAKVLEYFEDGVNDKFMKEFKKHE